MYDKWNFTTDLNEVEIIVKPFGYEQWYNEYSIMNDCNVDVLVELFSNKSGQLVEKRSETLLQIVFE